MAITNTTYLGLNKPDYDAVADIEVLNDNADIIDNMFDGTHLVETVNGVAPVGGEATIDLGVTSVNGQTGDVTITERSVKQLIDIIYPVGTYYETTNANFNPNTAWAGTTWQRITDGRVLIAGGGDYSVGNNYGEKTHKITVAEMPSHNHTASTANNGAHDHDKGSMNITGQFSTRKTDGTINNSIVLDGGTSGAFYNSGEYNNPSQSLRTDYTRWVSITKFEAKRSWTGRTEYTGAHNHAVTVNNTGSSTAMSLVQPSKAVARWLRTA